MILRARVRLTLMGLATIGVSACAGYNFQIGTGGYGEFTQVYSIPATSLTPWGGGRSSLPPLPPPSDGGAGSSTLPAARSDLPPDRSPGASSN